jgi:hypothetical protein
MFVQLVTFDADSMSTLMRIDISLCVMMAIVKSFPRRPSTAQSQVRVADQISLHPCFMAPLARLLIHEGRL